MVRAFRRLNDVVSDIRNFYFYSPAARWTAIVCLAVFLVQRVCERVECVQGYSFEYLLLYCFGLCPALLSAGFVWQLITYMFLHLNWMHLIFNVSAILLLGASVETEIGSKRFLRVLLLGGIVGGLIWALFDLTVVRLATSSSNLPQGLAAFVAGAMKHRVVTPEGNTICIGASGGVFALVGVCAALFPKRDILLFLVWPMRARTFAIALGIGAVIFMIYGLGNVAHLTHLVGGVAGYLYGLRLAADGWGDETE